MTKINCNYADESQIIIDDRKSVQHFGTIMWEKYGEEFNGRTSLKLSFWSWLEVKLDVMIDLNYYRVLVVQCKSKEEALKFKLKYL